MVQTIFFHKQNVRFNLNGKKNHFKRWIKDTARQEDYQLGCLNIILCDDDYLYQLNKKFLNHNTYTDIITFDNSDKAAVIEGDIYISIPRVKENAKKFSASIQQELSRVLIHGILHLIGYNDQTLNQKKQMKEKEDYYLEKLSEP